MTDAERKLWRRLRGNQLGAKFRRQHPYLDFILDFVCLERRLIVEIDGSQHMAATEYDAHRSEALRLAGFRVLRFWSNEALTHTDAVIQAISAALENPSPPPALPLKGRGCQPSPPPLEGEGVSGD